MTEQLALFAEPAVEPDGDGPDAANPGWQARTGPSASMLHPAAASPTPAPAMVPRRIGDSGGPDRPATLGEVIHALEERPGLAATRRRDLVSALRGVARFLRLPEERVPADPGALRRQLAGIHPAAFEISAKRFANIRADALAALRLVGAVPPDGGSGAGRLSLAWRQLRDACPRPEFRWRLSRFMGWCSVNGVEPPGVEPGVLERFVHELETSSLSKAPDAARRQTAAAWNACAAAVAGWPQVRLPTRISQREWTLPLTAFPESFRADVDAYLRRLACDDLLADDGPLQPLRPATLQLRRQDIRAAASALVLAGLPAAEIRTLADLVRPDRFKDCLGFLLAKYGGKTRWVSNIATTLGAIARHHARLPEADMEKLRALRGRVRVRQTGMARKNADRLHPFEDPRVLERLLLLPAELMRGAGAKGRPPRRAALDAQAAVALEVLLMAPIRIGNLASLRIGTHLLFQGTGRDERARIVLRAEEVKNGQDLDFPLPPESTRLIRRYLARFWPTLAAPGGGHLFPGQAGGAKRPPVLGTRLTRVIRDALGCEVNPHLMRHLAARTYLSAVPGAYEAVRRVLGHASINTTLVYTGVETTAAVRHFDEQLLRLRRAAETEARPRRKGGRR